MRVIVAFDRAVIDFDLGREFFGLEHTLADFALLRVDAQEPLGHRAGTIAVPR